MDSIVTILVALFIGAAIMLTVGTMILGNAYDSFDCSGLGGNSTTGWQSVCNTMSSSAQGNYILLTVLLIVIAAIAVLYVVRFL